MTVYTLQETTCLLLKTGISRWEQCLVIIPPNFVKLSCSLTEETTSTTCASSIQNLQVVAADSDRGLIFVKGGLPGSKGSWLSLKDSVKKALSSEAPYPAGYKGETVKQETPKEEAPKEETSKEEAPKQETSKEEAPKEEIKGDSEMNTEESKDKEN